MENTIDFCDMVRDAIKAYDSAVKLGSINKSEVTYKKMLGYEEVPNEDID